MQSSLLVIRFGSLGDVVLTSATVLNLRLAFPEHRIVYLTRERFRSIVERFDGVDQVETVPERISAVGLFRKLLDIEKHNFDRVIDLHGNFRSWLARSVMTANHRQVYPKRRLERWLATRRKKTLPAQYPHTIDLYNEVLTRLGERGHCRRPLLSPPALHPQFASAVDTDRPLVLLAPGAAHPVKAWPVERFAETAAALISEHRVRVVWAITSAEKNDYSLPPPMKGPEIVELVDCPLDQLAAMAGRAMLAITNDSGVGHLASAVGTPVLALFGPTHPVLGFAPRGLRDRVMEVEEPCRPCSRHGKRVCWREERYCFTRLAVDAVVGAAADMLHQTARLSPALFVDRDGTVIVDKHYLADPDQIELIDGVVEALRLAHSKGYKIVLVSNQSGVAKGYHSLEAVEQVNQRLLDILSSRGVQADGVYFCPHHARHGRIREFAVSCDCRKPSPGMAEQAALDLDIDLRRSLVVGDSLVDLGLGRVIGAHTVLVRTGYGSRIAQDHSHVLECNSIMVADDLRRAVEMLLPRDALTHPERSA